ncbi:MAG: DUF2007 domain-containing protein [bacterium]|nr:DUF2007 domain-containing protein [bacterium]
MSEEKRDRVNWKALPPLEGGVYVGMVTEVLDNEGIPNLVKSDLEAGGLGMIAGTQRLGEPWRIQVPEEFYDRAMEIYESLLRREGGTETDETEQG